MVRDIENFVTQSIHRGLDQPIQDFAKYSPKARYPTDYTTTISFFSGAVHVNSFCQKSNYLFRYTTFLTNILCVSKIISYTPQIVFKGLTLRTRYSNKLVLVVKIRKFKDLFEFLIYFGSRLYPLSISIVDSTLLYKYKADFILTSDQLVIFQYNISKYSTRPHEVHISSNRLKISVDSVD